MNPNRKTKHCEIIFGQERTNIIMKATKLEILVVRLKHCENYIQAKAYEYKFKYQKLSGN